MALTDIEAKTAKPGIKPGGEKTDKPYPLTDGGGLYLEIMPTGSKYWRWQYRYADKRKRLALGVYPAVTIKEARRLRDKARDVLDSGIDPGMKRKADKINERTAQNTTLEAVALEWLDTMKDGWSQSHGERTLSRLKAYIFPFLGQCPVDQVEPPTLLQVVRRIEAKGTIETAHRTMNVVGQVMRYAVQTGKAQRDPTADLKGALKPVQVKHHATLTDPIKVGELLRVINAYKGSDVVRSALRLSPLVFLRPGELRHAEWSEFDFDAAEWQIPAHKMKRDQRGKANGQAHVVPLSVQALVALREIQHITGHRKYVFPSTITGERPMSDNTIRTALLRMGFDAHTMSAHGFRAMARTMLDERLKVRIEVIEMQLAHSVRDPLGRAYNRTAYLDERRDMMQRWADYLDELATGAQIIPLKTA